MVSVPWPFFIACCVAGLLLVGIGVDYFTDGAVAEARRLGTSVMLLGMIGLGLEPESLGETLGGATDPAATALAAIVGSITFTALAGLGLGALVAPVAVVPTRTHRAAVGLMVVLPVVLALVVADGSLSRIDGGVLLALAPIAIVGLWWVGRGEQEPMAAAPATSRVGTWAFIGFLMMMSGAGLLESAARGAIERLDTRNLAIGMVVIAMALSLEELPRMWVPVWRGRPELAVANVTGTAILLVSANAGVLGLTSPLTIPTGSLWWHLGAMLAAVVLAALALASGCTTRPMGAGLAGVYALYACASLVLG